ncbi:hypothetical protein NDU88_006276 [Pleurodeles waltl]|uniref:Nuclear RNA export factor Tap RNA-binding domain-containing protein n=1 Tax=Pleurodeles waltl TaxID=8319 RepID=A0AAV7LS08_PLEWA|nr:hypothetical protein NDU88_006276 [Pleurodeles waltl]
MENQQQWYRITVPHGERYEKSWLLSTLQSACILHFTPLDFHLCSSQAQFYLKGADVANVLKQLNRRIQDPEGRRIAIEVEECGAPPSLQKVFEDFPQMNSSPNWKRDDVLAPETQWYRVTILNGSWCERAWLLFLIQSSCRVTFSPSDFHYKGMKARFYVQGKSVADAIQWASGTIADNEGRLLTFLVERSPEYKPSQTCAKSSRS